MTQWINTAYKQDITSSSISPKLLTTNNDTKSSNNNTNPDDKRSTITPRNRSNNNNTKKKPPPSSISPVDRGAEFYRNWRPVYRKWMKCLLRWPAMQYAMNWESLPSPSDSVLRENRNFTKLPNGFNETYAVLIDGVVRCRKCFEPKAASQPQTLLRHAAKKTCVATKKPSAIYVNSPRIRDLREKFSLKLSDLKRKLKKKLPTLVKEHEGTKYDQESFMSLVQQILERRFYLGRSHPMVYEDLWPDEMNSVNVLMGLKCTDYTDSIEDFNSKAMMTLSSPLPISRGSIACPVLEPPRRTESSSSVSSNVGDLMAQSMLQNAKDAKIERAAKLRKEPTTTTKLSQYSISATSSISFA